MSPKASLSILSGVTMERPVLRSELRSVSASPSPPSDDEALQRLRNLNSLQFNTEDVQMDDASVEPTQVDEDEEMMFRLFAPSKPAATDAQQPEQPTVQKIRVRSPSVDPTQVGFLKPSRPQSYYFAETASGQDKAAFNASAISAEQILKLSTIPRPGSAYNWKVLHMSADQLSRAARLQTEGFAKLGRLEAPSKRRRAGKKLRIKMRTKAAATKAKQEAAQKAKEAKDEAEKEKRTRRNREKKVKRKAKEKAKKTEGGGDAVEAEGEDSDDE